MGGRRRQEGNERTRMQRGDARGVVPEHEDRAVVLHSKAAQDSTHALVQNQREITPLGHIAMPRGHAATWLAATRRIIASCYAYHAEALVHCGEEALYCGAPPW
eukprot:3824740-Rhodomonas_salina.1